MATSSTDQSYDSRDGDDDNLQLSQQEEHDEDKKDNKSDSESESDADSDAESDAESDKKSRQKAKRPKTKKKTQRRPRRPHTGLRSKSSEQTEEEEGKMKQIMCQIHLDNFCVMKILLLPQK